MRLRLEKSRRTSRFPPLIRFLNITAIGWGVFGLIAGVAATPAESLADRVVILTNRDEADSERVARHYAEVRHVPWANVIALPMPRKETIGWREFIDSIWKPLQAELVRRQWIDAIPTKLTDEVGRVKYAFSGHRISYLVVCRGVPLRISHDAALARAATEPMPDDSRFRVNNSSVDSELSLLAHPTYPISGYVVNPLFARDDPSEFELAGIVKVSRLDGPSVEDALGLVDRAVAAERTGLAGRAYIDLGGNHPDGDRWLKSAAQQLEQLGFDTDVDRKPGTMPATARIDAPAIYLGWYAGALNGPFALPGFHFPAGAIALHIHSFSAVSLRSTKQHWCGPLLARGITATVGNVFEPYLQLTHRPDLLVRALLRGETFGDAATYAMPVLSWQSVAVGDPLYRPFATSLDEQWKHHAELPPDLAGYVTIRWMHELTAARRTAEATTVARDVFEKQPSLALGLALATRLRTAGDLTGAAKSLEIFAAGQEFRPDEWALVQAGAHELVATGRADRATATLANLFRDPKIPRELRAAWLPEAINAAVAAGEEKQAAAWRTQFEALATATAAPKK